MTAANFQACLDFTLREEGGYTNDPRDPGGATNHGITLATLQDYAGNPDLTAADIENIDPETVRAIYRTRYWDAAKADNLAPGLDLMLFDFGVNAGPDRSIELLQRVLGVTADGVLGPWTMAGIGIKTPVAILAPLNAEHETYYRSLPDFPTYGNGWLARCARRLAAAEGMLKGQN